MPHAMCLLSSALSMQADSLGQAEAQIVQGAIPFCRLDTRWGCTFTYSLPSPRCQTVCCCRVTPQLLRLNSLLRWSRRASDGRLGPGEHSLTLDVESFRNTPRLTALYLTRSDPLTVRAGAFGTHLMELKRLHMWSCLYPHPTSPGRPGGRPRGAGPSVEMELQLSADCEAMVPSLRRLQLLRMTKQRSAIIT